MTDWVRIDFDRDLKRSAVLTIGWRRAKNILHPLLDAGKPAKIADVIEIFLKRYSGLTGIHVWNVSHDVKTGGLNITFRADQFPKRDLGHEPVTCDVWRSKEPVKRVSIFDVEKRQVKFRECYDMWDILEEITEEVASDE